MQNHTHIYKLLREEEWLKANETSTYAGSADDIRDGFIHFSAKHQLEGTASKYFGGEERARLLEFPTGAFDTSLLKWEISRGGDAFPHLYGPLNISIACRSWVLDIPAAGTLDLSFLKDTDNA